MKKLTFISAFILSIITLNNWGQQCSANFNATLDNNGNLTIVNNSTIGANISFGDNSNTGYLNVGDSMVHTYTSNGEYNVCATIIDSSQTPVCYDMYCDSISVTTLSSPCNASANYNVSSANGDSLEYTFNLTDSSSNYSVTWDFGDGNIAIGDNYTHIYTQPGTYNVCAIVTDQNNCTDTVCNTLNVAYTTNSNCQANFQWYQVYDSTANQLTNEIYIIDNSTGNNLIYNWSLEGTNYYVQNPTHTITNPSNEILICLEVTTADSSCSSTHCDTIVPQGNFSTYELRMFGGYTDVKEFENSTTFNVNSIYPNPTRENATLNIHSSKSLDIQIRITDLSGKIVLNNLVNITNGDNNIEINSQDLSKGMYIISIIDEKGNNKNQRFIKK